MYVKTSLIVSLIPPPAKYWGQATKLPFDEKKNCLYKRYSTKNSSFYSIYFLYNNPFKRL
jgi:hypothetical protein